LKIFCDFDGTITYQDAWIYIGNYFIKDKNKHKKIISAYESGQIGSKQCYTEECSLIEDFDAEIMDKIVDDQRIDTYFISFYNFCKVNSIEIVIVSEGMEYYIDKILRKHGINVKYFANEIVLKNNKISLTFPNSDAECPLCGCCKRNILLTNTSDDEISVYIGDGQTDNCVVHYADIVFAKKTLASYCWKNNITYFDYNDFQDIRKKLEKILKAGKIKPRQEARLKRREAYLSG
jgi:2-hydroxy-3-keto-5-methylthiopentenyl-1-phosphate phosphatase